MYIKLNTSSKTERQQKAYQTEQTVYGGYKTCDLLVIELRSQLNVWQFYC